MQKHPYANAYSVIRKGRKCSHIIININTFIPVLFILSYPVKRVCYADDITVWASGPKIPQLESMINKYLRDVSIYLKDNSLLISAPKSTVTLFTPDKHQFQTHPNITLEDTQLPLECSPKILGVIMDTSLSFHKHCNYVSERIDKRNNMLKALAGSSWGQEKETLLMTYNTNTPTRVPNTTLQQTSSPDITTVSNTLYNRTSWTTQHALSSDHLPIITTINIRHDYRLQQNRRTFTNYKKADWTRFTEDTESAFAQTTIPTNIHTANRIFTNIILMADKHNIPKGKMHSNCRLLPEDIVCKITQRNNIRRANTCDPALKLLNEEITSDIQKHKQNI